MKVIDLIEEMNRDIPGSIGRGFLALVNRETERLYSQFEWTYYWARSQFALPEVFTNVTLTNGSAVVTISTAYFQEHQEGTTITATVGSTDYVLTILSVDSETQLTLSEVWGETTTAVATLTFGVRGDWRLPTNFRAMRGLTMLNNELHDPHQYTMDKQSSTGRELVLWTSQPTGTAPVVVDYVRNFTPVTSPDSDIDISDIMEQPFYLALQGRLLSIMMTGAIEDRMRVRRDENTRLYMEALMQAKSREQDRRNPTLFNKRVMFSNSTARAERRYV